MHSINQLKSALATDQKALEERIADQISELRSKAHQGEEKRAAIMTRLSVIEDALASEKIEIYSIRYSTHNAPTINVSGIPTGRSHKLIKDAGYNADGSGRNQKRLNAKAENLENIMVDKTGLLVDVNPFSFEKSSGNTQDTILIEFTIA